MPTTTDARLKEECNAILTSAGPTISNEEPSRAMSHP